MKFLLDTHVFLWAITNDPRLSPLHWNLFIDGENKRWLSVASVWELLIKTGTGKLLLPVPAAAWLLRQRGNADSLGRPCHPRLWREHDVSWPGGNHDAIAQTSS